MERSNRLASALRVLAAVLAGALILSVVGVGVARSVRRTQESAPETVEETVLAKAAEQRFKSDYASIDEMMAAAKALAVKEGEEGTVVMKNDKAVLPLAAGSKVALFGLAAYAPYPYAAGELRGGNDDAVDLLQALQDAGLEVNETVSKFYLEGILKGSDDAVTVASPGDLAAYRIAEVPPALFGDFGAPDDWKDAIEEGTTGICVFARGCGEGETYLPGSAVNYAGEATGKDPLALSEDELAVVDAARETCDKVVVLINSGNAMLLKDIAAGGKHEVEGIAYIGLINDYQCVGVARVLTGAINATGALPETYAADNASMPAMRNFGGGPYADYKLVSSDGDDPRYPGESISNAETGSATYSGSDYLVEAEGIYVGYKYYETRYFDAMMTPSYGARSAVGATQGYGWNYGKEVVYTFGHGLSYLDYTQTLKSLKVDKRPEGNVTAVIELKNNSDQDGYFLAQLYFQSPYTEYDIKNMAEKPAVSFLNSAKAEVPAGGAVDVTITVPTKYIASYDYINARTYILDEGDFLFTAAAGAHAAVNNFINFLGGKGDGTTVLGPVLSWTNEHIDFKTFSVENGVTVTNAANDADLNHWTGDPTVTYLSRQSWDGTFPINYNNIDIRIGDSPREEEWISALRSAVYTIRSDDPADEGEDKGLRFDSADLHERELENVNDAFWDRLVSQISIDEAAGAVVRSGSGVLTNIGNPDLTPAGNVSGFTESYTDEASGKSFRFNIHSQTLMGSSFNPALAYEWGRVEGNSGLWLQRCELWGVGLSLRRTPYSGRNCENLSEDAMLTNRLGKEIVQGCAELGVLNGPKYLGCLDQEHQRFGLSVYLNEQKLRESDLRCFQGALEETDALAVVAAPNRLGAVPAAAHTGLLQRILRGEWAYKGLITVPLSENSYYFSPESMIMAGITQAADFSAGDAEGVELGKLWSYFSAESVKDDAALIEQARENLKYLLYAYANSAALDFSAANAS